MLFYLENDQTEYQPYVHPSEREFERLVVKLADRIFGTSSIYVDIKKRIGRRGVLSIPDGYLLDLADPCEPVLYVVENELVSHDLFKHIGIQLLRFVTSYEETR